MLERLSVGEKDHISEQGEEKTVDAFV